MNRNEVINVLKLYVFNHFIIFRMPIIIMEKVLLESHSVY